MKKGSGGEPLDNGRSWLRSFRYSPRDHRFSHVQWLVAQLVACGLADKEIAYLLGISSSTVKAHTGKIIRSLGFFRRSQLVRYIWEARLFHPEETEALLAERQEKYIPLGRKIVGRPVGRQHQQCDVGGNL